MCAPRRKFQQEDMKRMNYMNGNGNVVEKDDPFTSKIIGLAIQVHSELGPGFLESIYHQALLLELLDAAIDFTSQAPLTVFYKERPVGSFHADLVIEQRLLLELKAVDSIVPVHEHQVVNYLKATGLDLGLILNFGRSTLQIRRKFRNPISPQVPCLLQGP
jgi:GxxExxY protein